MWSNSSRCRIVSVYLSWTWCLYTWSCLDNLITMHFSINCSTVICSPTVILMLSWEKPLVKPMAPGSIFHHISFRSTISSFLFTFFAIFTFRSINQNYQKILLYRLSISIRSHFGNNREGIDNPFVALVASWCLFVQVFGGLSRCLLLDWYIGSQNWGKYLRYFAASPFPLQGKTNAVLNR